MFQRRFLVLVCCLASSVLLAERILADQDAPDEHARFVIEQAEAAKKVYEAHWTRHIQTGTPPFDYAVIEFLCLWSRRWCDAERECDKAKDKQIAACSAHLDRMRKLESDCEKAVQNKLIAPYEATIARYHRIEAEKGLAEAKRQK